MSLEVVSTADLLEVWVALKRDVSDEPRDESGRWSTGGDYGFGSNDSRLGRTYQGGPVHRVLTSQVAELSKRDAARTRTISSGGKRRDDVLDPIVARVRQQLIDLVALHSNRNKRDVSDEARDEGGRWTADGGGDWASAAIKPDGSVDLKAVMKGYSTAHYGTDVRGMAGCKPDEGLSALSQLGKLQDQFPGVKIGSIGLTDQNWEEANIARTSPSARTSTIELNPSYWNEGSERTLYGADVGFHPDGTSNPSGFITHEFGHAVSSNLFATAFGERDRAAADRFRGWIKDVFSKSAPVSGYARKSDDEKFAELFSGAMTKGSNVYDSLAGQEMRAMLRDTGVWKGPTP